MQKSNTVIAIREVLQLNNSPEAISWLAGHLDKILSQQSSRDLYLTYSLIAKHFPKKQPTIWPESYAADLKNFKQKKAHSVEIARVYLLINVLAENQSFFSPKVEKLIQIADKGELVTFLKYLDVLPNASDFKTAGVEALRSNIESVFDAIALDNEYPNKYFNDQEWNQMYLKAAFLQRDLARILHVDQRANKELARIISDYAHERWAASRAIDPLIWRPVANYIDDELIKDMQHLIGSDNPNEVMAGALCCFYSSKPQAKELLDQHSHLKQSIENGKITWQQLNKEL